MTKLNDTLITTEHNLVPGFRSTVPGKIPVRKAGRSGYGSRLERLYEPKRFLSASSKSFSNSSDGLSPRGEVAKNAGAFFRECRVQFLATGYVPPVGCISQQHHPG